MPSKKSTPHAPLTRRDSLPSRSLFRQAEAARYLEISRHLVRVAIKSGQLTSHTLGSQLYVTRASLVRYRAALVHEPPASNGTAVAA
jgi:excisionase family DNA binding protein